MDKGMPPPAARPPSLFGSDMRRQVLAQRDSAAGLGPLPTIEDDAPITIMPPRGAAGAGTSGARDEDMPDWSRYFTDRLNLRIEGCGRFRLYVAGDTGPVVFCIHGGGYTGLTWALLAARLRDRCRIAALDCRGHGDTTTEDDADLSADTLCQDAVMVWQTAFGEEAPPTVLCGHSMGAAIAIRIANSKAIPTVEGLVAIDVVEGTALAALPHMLVVLRNRPPSFPSLAAALAWARNSGMSRNAEAAAISLPAQLRREVAQDQERWVWRTPLHRSQPHWEGWYSGLSDIFLRVAGPKMLILAGSDRLDKTLTIGQMQGRFQLVLLPQAGHAVHEDEPDQTAEVIGGFLRRFRMGEPKLGPSRAQGLPPVLPIPAGPPFQQ